LCANHGLHYVSGDGQEARPGQVLPMSLRVRVANGQWPRKGARVRFEILDQMSYGRRLSLAEAGAVKGMNPVAWGRGRGEVWSDKYVVETDERGLAQAQWMLGTESRLHAQRVRATLVDANDQDTDLSITFTAFVSSSDPAVKVVLSNGTEVDAPPGSVVPVIGFAGLRFRDLLVALPPPDTSELAWWPGVRVTLQATTAAGDTLVGMEFVLPGLSVPEPDDSLLWWHKPPKTTVMLSTRVMRDFRSLRTGAVSGPLNVHDFDIEEASFARSLDASLREAGRPRLEVSGTVLRRRGDRITAREALPAGELALAVRPDLVAPRVAPGVVTPVTAPSTPATPAPDPAVDPAATLPPRDLIPFLMRVHLRPWMFPGRVAAGAADFETWYWLDPEAKYVPPG
jgi:hypothetical protein